MNAQELSKLVKWDGGLLAEMFIEALSECNFHAEAKIIESVWVAMQNTPYQDSRDSQKLLDAAIRELNKLEL